MNTAMGSHTRRVRQATMHRDLIHIQHYQKHEIGNQLVEHEIDRQAVSAVQPGIWSQHSQHAIELEIEIIKRSSGAGVFECFVGFSHLCFKLVKLIKFILSVL